MVVYVKTSARGRVECELCGLLDDKLHFIKTVCVEANTTIRILGSNPLSAPDLLLFCTCTLLVGSAPSAIKESGFETLYTETPSLRHLFMWLVTRRLM